MKTRRGFLKTAAGLLPTGIFAGYIGDEVKASVEKETVPVRITPGEYIVRGWHNRAYDLRVGDIAKLKVTPAPGSVPEFIVGVLGKVSFADQDLVQITFVTKLGPYTTDKNIITVSRRRCDQYFERINKYRVGDTGTSCFFPRHPGCKDSLVASCKVIDIQLNDFTFEYEVEFKDHNETRSIHRYIFDNHFERESALS